MAAEYSLIRVRRTRIEELVGEGNRGAKRVSRLIAQPGRFLATIQIGVTFVGFLAAAFAGASIVDDLALFFDTIPVLAPSADLIALLVVTAIVASSRSCSASSFRELSPLPMRSGSRWSSRRRSIYLAGFSIRWCGS